MSKIKAVVLEKSGSRYTVLDKNGTFRHVKRKQDAEVGEEIELKLGFECFKGWRAWVGVAAIFLMVLTTIVGWNLYQVPTAVALLSVDINPSLQFTIDGKRNVLEINTQNEDAERLISKIDLKGKPIDEVLGQIVTEAYNQKFLKPEQPWVVVGYSSLIDDGLEQAAKGLNENQIISWLSVNTKENGFTPQVAFFSVTTQDRELAEKGDLTIGEYALWQTAVEAGVETQPEKLKETTERVRLLEDSKVRAKVKEKKETDAYAALSKKQIPEQDKAKSKDAVLQKYKQGIDQRNKRDKAKEETKGNGINRDKKADRDKDRDSDEDKQRSRGSQRNDNKNKGEDSERGKEKGQESRRKEPESMKREQESKKKDVLINTGDKARNPWLNDQSFSRERVSPIIPVPKTSDKKGSIGKNSQLRWETSRSQKTYGQTR
ncbi:anti-sigma factor domain-containing protein [Desulfosporosinus youngiae]|uniref:RsgI N-terminal anti-sigma domain-containing protein n=1 Tax=Desulfosporosinus youngiae DSM 17734 TaxID=768710 RepID=H5Y0J4_9FIRM|nr:anti-sigma factor domain-containing protein [Desulfosporosinus youngiae]EHQ92250.1 hypothetical protein DesyoDRAFT_5322 [Desulfosporosinus youngiae DSM 17734]